MLQYLTIFTMFKKSVKTNISVVYGIQVLKSSLFEDGVIFLQNGNTVFNKTDNLITFHQLSNVLM